MRRKELELVLSHVQPFYRPIERLEQYQTPSSIAAEMLHIAYMDGNVEGKKIADLGCGSGILALGAGVLGASKVYGVDIEPASIEIAISNRKMLSSDFTLEVDFICQPVSDFHHPVDTVIQNPPFGIKSPSADREFLETALEVASSTYSLHHGDDKTRRFINSFVKDIGGTVEWSKKLWFGLPRTLEHHTKDLLKVRVELYKITK